jgi:hypothetical protein
MRESASCDRVYKAAGVMSVAVAEEPRLLHEVPGRVRLHMPAWSGAPALALDSRLRRIQGVRSAQANPLTRNVLVRFDPDVTTGETILEAVRALGLSLRGEAVDGLTGAQPSPPAPARAPRRRPDRAAPARLLGLAAPPPLGWTLIAAGAVAAVGISRVFSSAGGADLGRPALPAPPSRRLLPPPRET